MRLSQPLDVETSLFNMVCPSLFAIVFWDNFLRSVVNTLSVWSGCEAIHFLTSVLDLYSLPLTIHS